METRFHSAYLCCGLDTVWCEAHFTTVYIAFCRALLISRWKRQRDQKRNDNGHDRSDEDQDH
jgi:hypothetical protein